MLWYSMHTVLPLITRKKEKSITNAIDSGEIKTPSLDYIYCLDSAINSYIYTQLVPAGAR